MNNLQHTEDLYKQLLKDYDELQQELAKEKEEKDSWQRVAIRYFNSTEDYRLKYFNTREDYKARIEKAVELIKDNYLYYEDRLEDSIIKERYKKYIQILLDILNGRSGE